MVSDLWSRNQLLLTPAQPTNQPPACLWYPLIKFMSDWALWVAFCNWVNKLSTTLECALFYVREYETSITLAECLCKWWQFNCCVEGCQSNPHGDIYPFDLKSEWWFYFDWHLWPDWCLNPHIHPHDLEPGLLYSEWVHKEYFQDCCIHLRSLLWNQPIISIYQTNSHMCTALMVNLARSGWFLFTQARFSKFWNAHYKIKSMITVFAKRFKALAYKTNFTSPLYSLLCSFY